MKFLKRSKKSGKDVPKTPSRITNETVAEHREKVLAGGRRFKYPVQYQKHRLVINSIFIGIGAVVFLALVLWHQLYVAENSSKLIYRVTQVMPLPIASVDGVQVRYSEYLMRYRSSIFYLGQQNAINLGSIDGKRQSAFIQREELTKSEKMVYAEKLARQHKTSVKDSEVDEFIKRDIEARSVSLNAYERTVLKSFYDWSLSEYKDIVRQELLKRKVAFVVDTAAKTKAEGLLQSVTSGVDIATVATQSSDDEVTKSTGGSSGIVSVTDQDPHGLVATAQKLTVGQVSGLIQGTDGYYFIKLVSKDAANVQYTLVKVKLSAFETQFAELVKQGKVKEYITIEAVK